MIRLSNHRPGPGPIHPHLTDSIKRLEKKDVESDSTQNSESKPSDITRRLNSSFFTKQQRNICTTAVPALLQVNGWLRAYLMFCCRFTLNFEWNSLTSWDVLNYTREKTKEKRYFPPQLRLRSLIYYILKSSLCWIFLLSPVFNLH